LILWGGVSVVLQRETAYKEENRQAAKWLLEYPERRQAYINRMNSIQYLGATQYDGMPHGTDVGRPCEAKGIRLADLDIDKKWIMAIEDAERTLGPKKLAFLDIRRQAEKQKASTGGRPGWMNYTMEKYADWQHRRYGGDYVPSYNTLRAWWDEILNVAVRIAIRRGCL